MYGVGPNFETVVPGNPANPIGPDLASQDDWWFRYVLLTLFLSGRPLTEYIRE